MTEEKKCNGTLVHSEYESCPVHDAPEVQRTSEACTCRCGCCSGRVYGTKRHDVCRFGCSSESQAEASVAHIQDGGIRRMLKFAYAPDEDTPCPNEAPLDDEVCRSYRERFGDDINPASPIALWVRDLLAEKPFVDNPQAGPSEADALARRLGMSSLPDFGDWGNGPDDDYTPDEKMRRFYFAFNLERETIVGTGRVPPSWTLRRIREHGLFSAAKDLTVTFDIRGIRHVLEIMIAEKEKLNEKREDEA